MVKIVVLEVTAILLIVIGIAFMCHGIATLICNLIESFKIWRKRR